MFFSLKIVILSETCPNTLILMEGTHISDAYDENSLFGCEKYKYMFVLIRDGFLTSPLFVTGHICPFTQSKGGYTVIVTIIVVFQSKQFFFIIEKYP